MKSIAIVGSPSGRLIDRSKLLLASAQSQVLTLLPVERKSREEREHLVSLLQLQDALLAKELRATPAPAAA